MLKCGLSMNLTAHNMDISKIYRTFIAHTEGKISEKL